MKRALGAVALCALFGMLAMIGLAVSSKALVRRPGSFLRVLPPHPAVQRGTMDIKYNSYYIAGVSKSRVYLGNYKAPLHILVINKALTDSQQYRIIIPDVERVRYWSLRVRVDSPYFFLADGTVPRIYKGLIRTWYGYRVPNDSAYFLDFRPMGPTSFAIRSMSAETGEYELGKEMWATDSVVLRPDILEKQIDGKFCVDGTMAYDKDFSRLVYTYYYRNQFIVMDSNLNVISRGRTIDTVSKAKISVATMESGRVSTMSSPPLLVNRRCRVDGKWLFVNSNLVARNESVSDFDKLSVIDVYGLDSVKYEFSFYLSHFTYAKVGDFFVCDGKLFAIFDHFISSFDLQADYFNSKP